MDRLQNYLLKDMGPSLNNDEPFHLQGCLELLNTNSGIDVQVKLISKLSVYLMSNETDKEQIITYSPLYDTISNILVNCHPRKATVTFNFITALLYAHEGDGDRRRMLVVYARNMIRSSGCLAAMCELFVTTMMDHDAWRALCRCVAESCRGIEANQSYCTHLVPLCINRCSLRNIEVLMVLQSLLQNHNNNINLFMQCNGVTLFQRGFLQHGACLQLLATIVQSSKTAVENISQTNIYEELRNCLHVYGPQSQQGQWATIILYYASKVKCNENVSHQIIESVHTISPTQAPPFKENMDNSADTVKYLKEVMREILRFEPQDEPKRLLMNFISKHDRMDIPHLNDNNICPDKTVRSKVTSQNMFLDETVRSTVNSLPNIKSSQAPLRGSQRGCSQRGFENTTYHAQIRKMGISLKDIASVHSQTTFQANEIKLVKTEPSKSRIPSKQFKKTPQRQNKVNEKQDLSFTFLEYDNNQNMTANPTAAYPLHKTDTSTKTELNQITEFFETCSENLTINSTFEPKYVSTPKKLDVTKISEQETDLNRNKKCKSVQNTTINSRKKRTAMQKRVVKQPGLNKTVQENKPRSISGRFFNVINESCNILMKTVKNIFRPKTDSIETPKNSSSQEITDQTVSCSYSFTKYMLRRDELLRLKSNKSTDDDFHVEQPAHSCDSCNNTLKLKEKLANDKHLKLTVRKLKVGINLFGCDFKKISRAMWPQESYMTPAVVYTLYRKLLKKKNI